MDQKTPRLPPPLGPSRSWKALAESHPHGDPFHGFTEIDELFRYDGWGIHLGRIPGDGRIWMRSVVDTGPIEDGLVGETIHWIAYPDQEAIMATVHDAMVPTRETYGKALDLVVEKTSWSNPAPGEAVDCRVTFSRPQVTDIEEDDLPYAQLLPGRAMQFGPAADPWAEDAFDLERLHRWPLPRDEVLLADAASTPRIWLHRLERTAGDAARVVLEIDVDWAADRPSAVIHRLRFADETTMRATLLAAGAGSLATVATYRAAASIIRQRIEWSGANATLHVEPVEYGDIPDPEKPRIDRP